MVKLSQTYGAIVALTLLSSAYCVLLSGGAAAPAVATVAYTSASGATLTATATGAAATATMTVGTATATATATAATSSAAVFAESAGAVLLGATNPIGWFVLGSAIVIGTGAAPVDPFAELNNRGNFVPNFSDWEDSSEWRIR